MKGRTGVLLSFAEMAGQLEVLANMPRLTNEYLDYCEGKKVASIAGFARWITEHEGGQS